MSNDIALPKAFEESTKPLFGEARYAQFCEALRQAPQTTIRLNPFKITGCELAADKNFAPIAWCGEGRVLPHRPDFTFDPLLHAGVYYVQESSSMFIHHVVRHLVDSPVVALDLCAAPGGKSTTLRAALPEGSVVVANEPIKVRASILSENVQKQGHPDMVVTNNYPRDFRKADLAFDFILADVPCSGEGMFRKDPQAIQEWCPQNVEKCAELQRSIIEDIWPSLKPGGILVYSTCTYNEHEDEKNIQWIIDQLGAQLISIPVDPSWHVTSALGTGLSAAQHGGEDEGLLPVCRFIPGFTPGEGIFMAVLRKQDNDEAPRRKKDRQSAARTQQSAYAKVAKLWLQENGASGKGAWTVVETSTIVRAIPTRWLPLYEKAAKSLHVIHAGVGLGVPKGKQLVPAASLALSTALNRSAFTQVEIGWEQAIHYLRKEAISLLPTTPQGIVLLTYRGQGIGFCKNIGNRANNLYPQEWKIKTTHLPEQPINVL